MYLFIFRLMNEFTQVKDPFVALPVQKILLIEVTTTVIENSVLWDVKNQSLQVVELNSKIPELNSKILNILILVNNFVFIILLISRSNNHFRNYES